MASRWNVRNSNTGRIHVIGIIFLMLLVAASVTFAWMMSTRSAQESNDLSYHLVDRSASLLMEQDVKWEAGFWHDAYNMMLRKLGHFFEYLLVGMFSSLFFYALFEKILQRKKQKRTGSQLSHESLKRFALMLLATLLSIGLSFGASYLDEFYWQRISGRHPRWFDVGVDMAGVCLGILMCLFVFSVGRWAAGANHVHTKARIKLSGPEV
jgi:VanZ family protein